MLLCSTGCRLAPADISQNIETDFTMFFFPKITKYNSGDFSETDYRGLWSRPTEELRLNLHIGLGHWRNLDQKSPCRYMSIISFSFIINLEFLRLKNLLVLDQYNYFSFLSFSSHKYQQFSLCSYFILKAFCLNMNVSYLWIQL